MSRVSHRPTPEAMQLTPLKHDMLIYISINGGYGQLVSSRGRLQ